MAMFIRKYELSPPKFCEWSRDYSRVASEVKATLLEQIPDIRVEHVGSTSVKECGGKGIIDLLVLYRAQTGELERVRDAVDALGFQHQQAGHSFPEDRPMRVGAVVLGDSRYRLHVHLLRQGCEEEKKLCLFRDQLQADDQKRLAYIELKQQILHEQILDPSEYTDRKGSFFDKSSD